MSDFQSKIEFLRKGNFKLGGPILRNTPSRHNLRFMWLDVASKELRWSTSNSPSEDFKRVALSHIQTISRLSYHNHFGFQVDTRNHSIKFWAYSQQARDSWLIGLHEVLGKEEKKRILKDVNKEDTKAEVIQRLLELLRQKTGKSASVEDLPGQLEVLLGQQKSILNAQKEIQRIEEYLKMSQELKDEVIRKQTLTQELEQLVKEKAREVPFHADILLKKRGGEYSKKCLTVTKDELIVRPCLLYTSPSPRDS